MIGGLNRSLRDNIGKKTFSSFYPHDGELYLFYLCEFPLFVTKRTVASSSKPFRNTIEVKDVSTVSPGNA